jgi:hypothetical protein
MRDANLGAVVHVLRREQRSGAAGGEGALIAVCARLFAASTMVIARCDWACVAIDASVTITDGALTWFTVR